MNIAYTERYAAYRAGAERVFACPDSRQEERRTPLAEGFSVRTRYFREQMPDCCLHASESTLLDGTGNEVYTWRNLNDDAEFAALIRHRNGRRYLVFRRELYGYSVLEIETGRDFHFVPGQSFPAEGAPFRETFIWTGVRYDPVSQLLAASGCYWACPNETVLLDFSRPLEERPWMELHTLLDPGYDLYDDIDFDRWDGAGGLHLRVFDVRTGDYAALHLPAERLRRFGREGEPYGAL